MKNLKNLSAFVLTVAAIIFLVSCNNKSKIDAALDGKWIGSYTTHDDGDAETVTTTVEFLSDTHTFNMKFDFGLESVGGYYISVKTSGEWETDSSSIIFIYDPNTIDVSVFDNFKDIVTKEDLIAAKQQILDEFKDTDYKETSEFHLDGDVMFMEIIDNNVKFQKQK